MGRLGIAIGVLAVTVPAPPQPEQIRLGRMSLWLGMTDGEVIHTAEAKHHRLTTVPSIPNTVVVWEGESERDDNEKIGAINDLLMDKSGNVKAAVIGVGGFLGMGAHLVAVSFDKIKFSDQPVAYTGTANTMPPGANRPSSTTTTGSTATTGSSATTPSKPNTWYPDHAVFNATRDELKAMPEFKYSQ